MICDDLISDWVIGAVLLVVLGCHEQGLVALPEVMPLQAARLDLDVSVEGDERLDQVDDIELLLQVHLHFFDLPVPSVVLQQAGTKVRQKVDTKLCSVRSP